MFDKFTKTFQTFQIYPRNRQFSILLYISEKIQLFGENYECFLMDTENDHTAAQIWKFVKIHSGFSQSWIVFFKESLLLYVSEKL